MAADEHAAAGESKLMPYREVKRLDGLLDGLLCALGDRAGSPPTVSQLSWQEQLHPTRRARATRG
jgi:hypothetical protein